jgi:putative ABC transport system permease protein
MRRFAFRLLSFFRSHRAEAELARELAAHVQLLEDKFIASGMSRDDARFAARRAFGGQVEQMKERQRDERSFRVLDQSLLDVKLALRMLIRYPGLTLVAVLGMSVAIAIAAGAFSIIDGLLDRTVPLHEGDRIVSLQNWDVAANDSEARLHDFVTWRDELTAVHDVGAFRQVSRNLIATGTQPEVVRVAEISASAFDVARVAPFMGRYLLDQDEREGAPPVVVIGYRVWQARFASDPNIVGRPLQLGPTSHAIVGVMPEAFAFPINHEFWVPFTANPARYRPRQGPNLNVFARLAPGATLESAQAELTTIGRRIAATFPATHAQLRPQVVPYTYSFSDMDDPDNALALRIIQYMVSILLGIVCVNVAILVYARTATRHAEIAVRSALGAGRRRIVAQLFIEALALSGVAAILGLVIVAIGLQQIDAALLQVIGPLPFWMDFELSPASVVYILVLAGVAAAIVGVVPALKATGRHVQHGLKSVSGGAGADMRLGKTWTALVVAQVAIAVALLPAAVYHTWDAARYGLQDYGFAADEILTASIDMDVTRTASTGEGTSDPAFRSRYADRQAELVRRVALESEITAVSLALHMIGQEATAWIDAEGAAPPAKPADYGIAKGSSAGHGVRMNRIGPEWFDVFDVPLVAGRTFTGADTTPGATAVIVNGHFGRDVLRSENVLGRRFRYVGLSTDANVESVDFEHWYEIVGIVGDIHPNAEPGMVNAMVYHPLTAGQFYPLALAMRFRGSDPLAFASRLREISAAVDPDIILRRVMRAVDFLQLDLGIYRLVILVLALLTASVVVLSAAGIYALMACTVEQRRKEIGIRAALGADPRRILATIFARAFTQLAAGALLGVVVATLLELASDGDFVGGRSRTVLPLVAITMMVVGLMAAWGPARRGLRIHPTETLRAE